MNLSLWLAWWMGLCFIALVAYMVGRRVGKKEGRALAQAAAPLQMRMRALNDGRCPVCGTVEATRMSRDTMEATR
ncbi:hypothetical protein GCM10025857_02340 [Alicyclobacillus contaminans]|uniref:hypothetical protein n=1 Tax=Alicyclobacillus contaminans TaxID=392016 RepID=UPI00047CB163|nr:hypothetical protein [Alicyclobacillus contaminans]GMA48877.1 hypothetical protein GCM10025857_02340 [Alicyclobacillus contaminans]